MWGRQRFELSNLSSGRRRPTHFPLAGRIPTGPTTAGYGEHSAPRERQSTRGGGHGRDCRLPGGHHQHADKVWTRWFLANGLQEPFVQYEIVRPGETFQSKCDGGLSIPSDYPNAFYCPVDGDPDDPGVVILPAQTMARMWTGDIFRRQVDRLKRTGDFAAGVITAHEFGHHVVDSHATQVGRFRPQKPNSELIADCFAGVWADSVRLEEYLEEGDIDEGLNALAVIGDDTGDHGTGPERDNAFSIGLNGTQAQPGGGEPLRCIEEYWK